MKFSFVNPYNFVSIFDKSPERKPVPEGTITGYIEYSLLTKGPVLIPNTSNDDIFGLKKDFHDTNDPEKFHKSYEFFSYEDLSDIEGNKNGKLPSAPVIPGSEIRGMFRSNYEILTNSCLPFINESELYKRTNEVFRSGLIRRTVRNGELVFDLYEAEDCLLRTNGANNLTVDFDWDKNDFNNKKKYIRKCYIQNRLQEGQAVSCFVKDRKSGKSLITAVFPFDPAVDAEKGYIIKGEDGPDMGGRSQQKHCAHVFIPLNRLVKDNVSLDVLDHVLGKYEGYKEYQRNYKEFKEGPGDNEYFPVYFSEIKENSKFSLFLSPACITRESYSVKLRDLLHKQNYHSKCEDGEKLCPACRLFGLLENDSNHHVQAVSRVRFSDLNLAPVAQPANMYDGIRTLHELSSPKRQNTEFYLQKPSEDAVFWTYEYYIDKNANVHLYDAKLNGRKIYWHQIFSKKDTALGIPEKNIRNMTVRPLAAGVTFSGKLFFDGITGEELNCLNYLLEGGEPDTSLDEKKHGYLVGSGKPIGLGSVAVKVDNIFIRKLNLPTDMAEPVDVSLIPYTPGIPLIDEKIRTQFLTYTAFDTAKDQIVTYPRKENPEIIEGKEEYPVYAWFTSNHWVRKKLNENIFCETAMANQRKQMAFAEYMKPLQPSLISNNLPGGERSQAGNSKCIVGGHPSNSGNVRKKTGSIEVATVFKMSPNGRYVKLSFSDGSHGDCPANGKTYQPKEKLKVCIIDYDEEYKSYKCKIVKN